MFMKTMAAIAVLAVAAVSPASAQSQMQRPPMDDGRGPPPGGMGGGPGGMHGRPDPVKMFAMMDTNHDGVVSKSEFMAFHTRMGMHGPGGPGAPGMGDGQGGH